MNLKQAGRFTLHLSRRLAEDNGFRAALRRAGDRTTAESRMLLAWAGLFESLNLHARDEEACHLVGTMMAHDRTLRAKAEASPTPQEPDSDGAATAERMSLGASLGHRVAADPGEANATDRRLANLLEATWEWDGTGSLPWRLRRTVLLLLSRNTPIDWALLLNDVAHWNHSDRYVQRLWAKDYYRQRPLEIAAIGARADEDDETTPDPDE